jgi:hypothetical protein
MGKSTEAAARILKVSGPVLHIFLSRDSWTHEGPHSFVSDIVDFVFKIVFLFFFKLLFIIMLKIIF